MPWDGRKKPRVVGAIPTRTGVEETRKGTVLAIKKGREGKSTCLITLSAIKSDKAEAGKLGLKGKTQPSEGKAPKIEPVNPHRGGNPFRLVLPKGDRA